MTINLSDNSPRISYTVAQGATQSAFVVPFEFFADADLNVYVDGTQKTLTTHYTTADDSSNSVAHTSGTTGYIHFTSGNHVTGASGGSTVVITRDIALERTTDFPTVGPFDVDTLNVELDKFIAIQGDLEDRLDRSLRLQDPDTDVSMELPLVATRKGTVLGFNATTGVPEAGPTIANVNSLSAITTNINTVAGIASNVTTVAGIQANVTTVAGIASNVTTVAGIQANVTTVAGIQANVTTVAGISSNVTTVAGISSDVTSVAGISSAVSAVNSNASNVNTVAGSISNVNTLASISANVTTVAGISSDVTTLANALSATTTYTVTVANVSGSNVFVLDGSNNPSIQLDRGNTYIFDQSDASNSGHPIAFKNGSSSYTTGVTSTGTPGSSGAKTTIIVDAAAPSSGLLYYCTSHGNAMGNTITTVTNNFSVVASNIGNINTVAGANTNINSVAGALTNINTVATNISGVNSFAERYRVASSDPSSSLDEGDLVYNTTSNALKYYDGSAWQAVQAVTTGISNGNVLAANANVVDNDFLRVDGTSIEGRSASELASDIGAATTDDATALAIALG
jgi:hypothetical protein